MVPEIYIIISTILAVLFSLIYKKNIKISFIYIIDVILLMFYFERNPNFFLFSYSDYELILKIIILISSFIFYKIFCVLGYRDKIISLLIILCLSLSISASSFVSLIISMDLVFVSYCIFLYQNRSIGNIGLIFAIISVSLMIITAIIVFFLIKTTSFNDIQYILSFSYSKNYWIYAAVLCLFASFCIKISAFPLYYLMLDCTNCAFSHLWIIFCTLRCCAILIFHKIMTTVFNNVDLHLAMIFVGICAIIFGSIFCISQTNIKKIFVYLMSCDSGIAIIASIGNGYHSRAAIIFLIINEIISFMGLFGAINTLKQYRTLDEISDLKGLHKYNLPLSISVTFLFLSILGVPPFPGILSKFHLCMFLLQKNFVIYVVVIILSIMICLACAMKISTAIWTNQLENDIKPIGLGRISICCIAVAITFISIPLVNKIVSLMMMEA